MPGPVGEGVSEKARTVGRGRRLDALTPGLNQGPFRVAVKSVDVKTTRNGDPYLELEIHDRTASWTARCWEGAEHAADFRPGAALEIQALTHDATFGPKFDIAAVRVLEEGEYSPKEFVASLPAEQVERLWNEFHGFLDSIRNPHLQALRKKVWTDERAAKYKWHVSAVSHHHNYLGGNLQHVVGILRVVEAVCTSYPEIDREVALFGGAIHDLGKLDEYEVTTTIRVTDDGKWKGHLVMGAELMGRLIAEVRRDGDDFPKNLEDHLVHMILSHHGKGAWGSPKPPATPEAALLHYADYVDSQTKGFLQYIEEHRDDPEPWARRWDPDIGESRNVRLRWDDEDPQA